MTKHRVEERRGRRRPSAPLPLLLTFAAVAAAGLGAVGVPGMAAGATAQADSIADASQSAPSDDFHPAGSGLVFADEFDGTALDRSAWCTRYQYGGGEALQKGYADAACTAAGGGTADFLNDELQRYRDVNSKGSPLHVERNGYLALTATKTGTVSGAPYESAMIRSKQEFRPDSRTSYYLTARVRLPDTLGSWPAFWLVPGMRNGSTQWPPEIDIFEGPLNGKGENADTLHMGVHGKSTATYNASNFTSAYGTLRQPTNIRGRWVEVGASWTASSVCWFFDGAKAHCEDFRWADASGATANPSPVLLNLAVGGAWAGSGGIEDAEFPITFDVDHVRVYSSVPGTAPTTTTSSSTTTTTTSSTTSTTINPNSPTGSTATTPTGVPAIGRGALLKSAASGLCLTPGAKGKAATIQPCAQQGWTSTSSGQLKIDGLCLDALGAGTKNMTPVGVWPCGNGANQKWRRTTSGTFVGVQSGRCLDVAGQRKTAGTKLQLWDCNGQANQKWTAVGEGPANPPANPPVNPPVSPPANPPASPPVAGSLATIGGRQGRSGVGYADARSWGQWRGQPVSSVDTWNDAASGGKITWSSMLPLYSMHDVVAGLPALNADLRQSTGDPTANVAVSVAQPMFATGDSYTSCANGTSPSNAQLDAMAKALADTAPNRSAFVRLGWEFNSGYHWKAATTDGPKFVTCWQRWHRALKAASPGLKLVWNPNSDMGWDFPLDEFWPGSAYVDAAGPDQYAKGENGKLSSPDQWTVWDDPRSTTAPKNKIRNPRGINAWASYVAAKGVPLAVPEWGVQNDGNTWSSGDPVFVDQMRSAFEKAASSPTGLAYEDYFDAGADPGFDCKHSLHDARCTKNAAAAERYATLWKKRYATP